MQIRLFKLISYLFLFSTNSFGQSTESNVDVEKLTACLTNSTFQSDFRICRETDSLFVNTAIYNNTKHTFNSSPIKTNCRNLEIIDRSEIDIENDAQRVRGKCKRGKIVLYSFETKNNISKFRFIDTCSNSYLELEIDKNNKSTVTGRGSF